MKKALYATTAAVALLAAGAVQAQGTTASANVNAETGIGAAVGKTADAVYEKSAQGVNKVKGTYHETMADSNARAAQDNLATGNLDAAATDAKDAAEHQSAAINAKVKAEASKSKASKDWAKAKAAVNTDTEVKTK
ncbi:MAG: hypothetical protein EON60_05000 [Alphaproteobacteria bacterium]|nr:MAG: hypothetical protein EON60_05000 [Alphaproteobacteria bacterium]